MLSDSYRCKGVGCRERGFKGCKVPYVACTDSFYAVACGKRVYNIGEGVGFFL